MSRYATRWASITVEEYHKIYNDELSLYASYTNSYGDDGLSFYPNMITTWGDNEKELIKSIATKENKEQEKWDYKYYKAIEWESDDDN